VRFFLILLSFVASGVSHAVEESEFESRYESEIMPYYNLQALRFHPYSNDASKKIPYKLIKRGHQDLLVILPGKGEPLERYAETLFDLKELARDILIVQFRGQGYSSRSLSDPEKTHIRKFNYVVDDLNSLFEYLDIKNKYRRISLAAHSMGAHHGIRYQLAYPLFDQLLLNAPLIGLLDEEETDKNYYLTLMLIGVGMANSYVPGKGGWRDWSFEENDVSQSMIRYRNFRRIDLDNPTVRLGSVTVRWAYEAIKSEKLLFDESPRLLAPITIFQAGKELIVSNQKQQMLCDQLPNCELIRVEDSMHNFLQEKDEYRNQYLEYVKSSL